MIFSRKQRPSFIPTLIILFAAMQISACSTEDRIDAVAGNIDLDTNGVNETNTSNATVFGGVDSGSVIEDDDPDNNNLLEIGGQLIIADSGNNGENFIANTIAGNYGNLVIDTTGKWNYAASNNQSIIQNLTTGATLIDNMVVSTIYGATHTIVITIIGVNETGTPPTGSNQAAWIGGIDTGSVIEDVDPDNDNLLEISAKLSIRDNDSGEAAFIASTIAGNYGNLVIHTDGNWHYVADNNQAAIQDLATGETLTESLRVSSVDGTAHIIRITIQGADEAVVNSPAVISGTSTGSVTEDVDPDNDNLLEVSGKLNITDNDTGEAAFIAKIVTGSYGDLVIDTAGNWNYAASNSQTVIQNLATGATLTDNLTVTSIDGTTHTIRITIQGASESVVNSPAVISGTSTGSVTEDVDPDNDNLLEVSGKLNITDNDAGEAVFIAKTITGSYGDLVIDTAGNWNYAASNSQSIIQNLATGATLTDNLTVSSIDGTTRSIVITINGVDENPASNISISWTAPVAREDNSALSLSAIAGYKIYYSTTQGQYSNSATINDGSATGYIFNNFASATYYFVVTTIDTDGRESAYSAEITISI